MSGSIFKDKSCVDDGVTCLWPFLYNLMKGFSYCSDILRWYICADHFADEFICSFFTSWINGLDVTYNSCVLASTSRLFFVEVIEVMSLEDSFSVVDAWLAGGALYSEFTANTFNVDLEVQLTHTTDDHFFALFINIDTEGWIFPFKFRKCFF